MAEDDESSRLVLKLIICLIAAASSVLVVTICHCITVKNTPPQHWRRGPPPPPMETHQLEIMSIDNSVAELLPAHKFQKSSVVGSTDGTCAICLCEFEDGEELRTMPECVHSFHVGCIDMWLYSHSNCPVCRAVVGMVEEQPCSPTLSRLMDNSNSRGSSLALLQLSSVV